MSSRSLRLPVESPMPLHPAARATSMPCVMVARHELWLNGFTVPRVPRTDMPPTMPSLPFSVCRARSAPSGTTMRTRTRPA